MKIKVADILHETMTDGPGFRTSIYCQGCGHHCPGCHNPQTWDFDGGKEYTVEELFNIIESDEFSDVTFSGGDPMFQVEAFTELARMVKNKTNKTIWCYSGYTYEEIIESPRMSLILPFLDVLVDGRFMIDKRNTDLRFRGSENQRIIYLKNGEIDKIEKV
jgi:anaerobic ribonucleoside-triphosphate reductase activating protein